MQQPGDPRDDHIDRHRVEPAAGDDNVGVALGRLDELQVHGAHRPQILLDHRLDRPPALGDIALQPADEAQVALGIDEQFALCLTFPNSV